MEPYDFSDEAFDDEGFGFDEHDEDDEYCCAICGEPGCVDACVCGAPLCHMHFEISAGFCNDSSEEHQRIVENAYNSG